MCVFRCSFRIVALSITHAPHAFHNGSSCALKYSPNLVQPCGITAGLAPFTNEPIRAPKFVLSIGSSSSHTVILPFSRSGSAQAALMILRSISQKCTGPSQTSMIVAAICDLPDPGSPCKQIVLLRFASGMLSPHDLLRYISLYFIYVVRGS